MEANLAAIYTNPGNVSGVRWCSGTLIGNDLFLSAGHCFDQSGGGWTRPVTNNSTATISPSEIATNMHVNFNFQVDPNGNLRPEEQFAVAQLVEYRLDGLDYAIVRLAGNPGAVFGTTLVSATDADEGDMLCIIGHPAGLQKQVEAGPAFHLHDTRIGYDSIDTSSFPTRIDLIRVSSTYLKAAARITLRVAAAAVPNMIHCGRSPPSPLREERWTWLRTSSGKPATNALASASSFTRREKA